MVSHNLRSRSTWSWRYCWWRSNHEFRACTVIFHPISKKFAREGHRINVRDRVRQGRFHVIWRPGKQNLAKYFSKHHPASHHRAIRQHHLYEPRSPDRPASNNYYACLQELPSHSYTMLLPFLAWFVIHTSQLLSTLGCTTITQCAHTSTQASDVSIPIHITLATWMHLPWQVTLDLLIIYVVHGFEGTAIIPGPHNKRYAERIYSFGWPSFEARVQSHALYLPKERWNDH